MAFARGRTGRVWLLSGLSVVFGLFLAIGAIFTGGRGWIVVASGGVATATVHGQSGDQRHRQYQVTFPTRDGATQTEWMDRPIGKDLRVGDQVKIRYDRAHPDNIYPASGLVEMVLAVPLMLLAASLVFVLGFPATLRSAATPPAADPNKSPRPHPAPVSRNKARRRRRRSARHPTFRFPERE